MLSHTYNRWSLQLKFNKKNLKILSLVSLSSFSTQTTSASTTMTCFMGNQDTNLFIFVDNNSIFDSLWFCLTSFIGLPHYWSCQAESPCSGGWFEGSTPEICIIFCCHFEKYDSSKHNLFVLPRQSQTHSTAR